MLLSVSRDCSCVPACLINDEYLFNDHSTQRSDARSEYTVRACYVIVQATALFRRFHNNSKRVERSLSTTPTISVSIPDSMAFFSKVDTVVQAYPETDPFATRTGNWSPRSDSSDGCDTPALLEAARAIAHAHEGYNVFSSMYGSNPLPVECIPEAGEVAPIAAYEPPPAIPEVELPQSLKLLQEVLSE